MSTHGFGKSQPAKSASSTKRRQAARQYDRMRADGTPDFEVYIRIQGKTQWYPVGAIAVKRSSQVARAIFSSQDELLKGAFRLYPVLRKHQQNLEYGYRLKEFKDDPIQLAVPPARTRGGVVPRVISQIKNRVLSLIKN